MFMKKFFLLLALALSLCAQAETIEGTWRYHPVFVGENAANLIDTEQQVYLYGNGYLSKLDKSTSELVTLTKITGLSDVVIGNVYYNYAKHLLVVAYTNSNIDLVYDDGRIVNVSDIHDAIISGSKIINDVTFAGDLIYVATDFGYAVINEPQARIVEYRDYATPLTTAARIGDRLIIGRGNALYGTLDSREKLSDFSSLGVAAQRVVPIDDNTFFAIGSANLARVAFDSDDLACSSSVLVSAAPISVQPTPTGWIVNFRTYYVTTDAQGDNKSGNQTVNKALVSSAPNGDGTLWLVDANGIHKNGESTYFTPNGWRSACPTFWIDYDKMAGKFYITSFADNAVVGSWSTVGNLGPRTICVFTYDGTLWRNETPSALANVASPGQMWTAPWSDKGDYYISQRASNTFYHVQDGQVAQSLTASDYRPTFDHDAAGNLWIVSSRENTNETVKVLPADKVTAATGVSNSDLKTISVPGVKMTQAGNSFKRQDFVVERKNGVFAATSGEYERGICFWRMPDGLDGAAQSVLVKQFVKPSGAVVDWQQIYVTSLAADSTGHIWVGTSKGLFFLDSDNAFNETVNVQTQEVNNGDSPYSMAINRVHVDDQNRKWIGTNDYGLFVLSPDGNEVLAHFTAGNSGLPADNIYDVHCVGTSAFVTTALGIAEFNMQPSAPVVDYAAVSASPTLLYPDFTGYVTISGLERGSYVKITNRKGEVVKELTADGEAAYWDACDDRGERPATGVYYIYAAPGAEQCPAQPQLQVKIIK